MDLLLKLKKASVLSSCTPRLIHVYALVDNTGQEAKLVLSASFL